MICDLSDFIWLEPIKTDPGKQDRNKKCVYHKDHSHNTKQCRSLHYLVEKLIRVGHLKQYIRSIGGQRKTTWDLAIQAPITPTAPKVFINYIYEGPVDEKYNSKRKRQRMLQATFVREQVSFIQHSLPSGGACLMDDIITPVNCNRVLQPHEDTLVLTLGISGFDVRRILVDPSSSVDLL